jgi:hypothetical protein
MKYKKQQQQGARQLFCFFGALDEKKIVSKIKSQKQDMKWVQINDRERQRNRCCFLEKPPPASLYKDISGAKSFFYVFS